MKTINFSKNISQDIINECGYESREYEEVRKILNLSVDETPGFELDEKIKKYAKNTHAPKCHTSVMKWLVPVAASIVMIFGLVIFLNLKSAPMNLKMKIEDKIVLGNDYAAKSISVNSMPKQEEKIKELNNIDVELALLDIEIGLTEYEITRDELLMDYGENSDKQIDTTLKKYNYNNNEYPWV